VSDGRLFDFALDQLDDVQPWGRAPEQTLSWFALTQGRYRLRVGDAFLLNYSDATVAKHYADWPDAYPGPLVDYYVVRLWEDVLALLPDLLAEVPPAMHDVLLLADAERAAWIARATRDLTDDEAADATAWIGARILDSGYLQHGPWLRFWSHAGQTFIAWDCLNLRREGIAVWSAGTGNFAVPTVDFLAELRMFHAQLMTDMLMRVHAIRDGWHRSGVAIDVDGLQREHAARCQALDEALARPAPSVTNAGRLLSLG